MLDEDTSELAVAVEDIVWPLDAELLLLVIGHVGGEGAHHCPGCQLRDGELLLALQHIGAQEDGEGQAISWARGPGIASHTTPCRLLAAYDGVELREVTPRGDLTCEIGIRAVYLVNEFKQ